MNVFKVPCLLFYVDLIVGEQEWQQGDHLGGYCGHLCVKWGVAEELERSEFDTWRWRSQTNKWIGCGVVRATEESRMS